MREELIRATPGKLAEKSEELADKFESNRDQLQKATEKVASKIRTPEQVDSLATRILNAFTGGKSLESQSDLFDNIAAASDIWGKGRKQLIEEYGEVTGKIISGTALAGSLLGGFTGGIAAGTTLGSLWWVFPSFITSSVQGGAMLGAGLTAAPFIALAHSIRGVRNLTRNAKMEVPLNDQQIASVASDWFIQHLRKIAEANQFTANNFFFQH
jgi:ribosomal protein S17E